MSQDLIRRLRDLVSQWRQDAGDYSGVMYYSDKAEAYDAGARDRQDGLADELQSVLDSYESDVFDEREDLC